MARIRLYKTLFVPDLKGHFKIWDREVSKVNQKVDEIVSLGNLVGCNDLARDNKDRGRNQSILKRVAFWKATYPNWYQLVGTNEIMALNYPDEWTNKFSNRMLRGMFLTDDPWGKIAIVNRGRLVTHGGLTYGLWKQLGSPTDVFETANMLNERYHKTLYMGRCYKFGDPPNFSANPVFAEPLLETYPSWITAEEPMPFDQVHSANSINTADGYELRNTDFSYLKHAEKMRFLGYGGEFYLKNGGFFKSIYLDLPFDEVIHTVPRGMNLLIETTPVIDRRNEMFLTSSDRKKRAKEVAHKIRKKEYSEDNIVTFNNE